MQKKTISIILATVLITSAAGNVYLYSIKQVQDKELKKFTQVSTENYQMDTQLNDLHNQIDENASFLSTCLQDIEKAKNDLSDNRKLIHSISEESKALTNDISYIEDMTKLSTYLASQTEKESSLEFEFPYEKEYQYINENKVHLDPMYGDNSLVINDDMAVVMSGNKMSDYSFAYQYEQFEYQYEQFAYNNKHTVNNGVNFYKVDNVWLMTIENIKVGIRGIEILQVNHEWYYRLFVDDYKKNRLGIWKPLENKDQLVPLYAIVEDTVKIATNIELDQYEVVDQVIPEDILALFPKDKLEKDLHTLKRDMLITGSIPDEQRFAVRSISHKDNTYTIEAVIYASQCVYQGTEPVVIKLRDLTISLNTLTNELVIMGRKL